jgi:hypothetical protein
MYEAWVCELLPGSFTNTLNQVIIYESASSPLVGFGELNDNIIKGLTSLLSVEQED